METRLNKQGSANQLISILGATLRGAFFTVIVILGLIVGLIIVGFLLSLVTGFSPANRIETIAVGHGYSIALDITPAHPILAEYHRSVVIYGDQSRKAAPIGHIDLPIDPGGNNLIGVLSAVDAANPAVILVDRYTATYIDLLKVTGKTSPDWNPSQFKRLGVMSNHAYPVKFIPCTVWPLLSEAELQHLTRLRQFCNTP